MYIMALLTGRFGPLWSTHVTIGHPKIAIAPCLLSLSDALVSCCQDKPYNLRTIPGLSLHLSSLFYINVNNRTVQNFKKKSHGVWITW